jgi:predicted DCC family thiol-disulfide oxidoreductase YuxK
LRELFFCEEISVFTELSDSVDRKRLRGWVLYDAECGFCLSILARVQDTLQAGGFQAEPLQSPWVRERLKLSDPELLREMRVLAPGGRVLGGADAVFYLAGALEPRPWWARILAIAGNLPLAKPLGRWIYRWVAARRQCHGGACSIADSLRTKKES